MKNIHTSLPKAFQYESSIINKNQIEKKNMLPTHILRAMPENKTINKSVNAVLFALLQRKMQT